MKKKYQKPLIKIKKININLFFTRKRTGVDQLEGFLAVDYTCAGTLVGACAL